LAGEHKSLEKKYGAQKQIKVIKPAAQSIYPSPIKQAAETRANKNECRSFSETNQKSMQNIIYSKKHLE
jgi:hypothetical protein